MAGPKDTLVHLGFHAGFEDWLRTSRKVMMAYLWVFPILAIGYLRLAPGYSGKPLAWVLILVVGVLVLLKLARYFISIELVLDRERQQLLLRRRIFLFRNLVSLAGVEELWAVVTAGEIPAAPVNYWWDYVTLLITRTGQRFRAASHGPDFTAAEVQTRELANDLGIEVLPSRPQHTVKVNNSGDLPRLEFKKVPLQAMDCLTVVFWAVMIFLTPILAVMLLTS
jgi:hypothetical protein